MENEPKVALFYDWLNQWGGAEKVLLDLIKIYPHAPVFTLVHDPKKTTWLPKSTKIITSSINKLPLAKKNPILYTPFYPFSLEQFDFSSYDIVISTTSTIGHCLITHPQTLSVCYFHNINRYVYKTPKNFLLLKPLLNIYKKFDHIFSKRPDYIFCNSKTVQQRIHDEYKLESKIIYPGVDTSFFTPLSSDNFQSDYFLVVSRLVPHKKIAIAIKACHQLNLKLKIVGDGRDKKNLSKIIDKINDNNIELLGKVSDQELSRLYQNCQALICPQEEDFGLTPIESQACGKPVIAFKKGGITETVINGKTGIFFKHQTTKSLVQALKLFTKTKFLPKNCIENSHRFSNLIFMLNFKQSVEDLWKTHLKKITTL